MHCSFKMGGFFFFFFSSFLFFFTWETGKKVIPQNHKQEQGKPRALGAAGGVPSLKPQVLQSKPALCTEQCRRPEGLNLHSTYSWGLCFYYRKKKFSYWKSPQSSLKGKNNVEASSELKFDGDLKWARKMDRPESDCFIRAHCLSRSMASTHSGTYQSLSATKY